MSELLLVSTVAAPAAWTTLRSTDGCLDNVVTAALCVACCLSGARSAGKLGPLWALSRAHLGKVDPLNLAAPLSSVGLLHGAYKRPSDTCPACLFGSGNWEINTVGSKFDCILCGWFPICYCPVVSVYIWTKILVHNLSSLNSVLNLQNVKHFLS